MVGDVAEDGNGNDGRITTTTAVSNQVVGDAAEGNSSTLYEYRLIPAAAPAKQQPRISSQLQQCSMVEEENPMAQMMWRTPSLKEFRFKELKIATMNFSPDSLLGQGGYGRIYKGWVDEKTLAPSSKMGIGMAVAIKELNPGSNGQGHNIRKYANIFCSLLFVYGLPSPETKQ
ncbi:hypothetical protein EZV62_014491 [Acer yangbiense]|uniref:Protein kinase domain-containing protein n=1 Tax=Acer yangbiense TaxID=1000413 RepID=A0A5C7HSU5_9ROSI|nr:hypothetical protein EZV62_014491 [Acer yangbiense]